jgi:hypothetical protein
MTKVDGDKSWRLYSSAFKDGLYLQASPLAFSTGATADVDPEIAPDESFLIFSSAGRATSQDTHEHLYITCRSTDGWSPARQIRFPGDPKRPHVADDSEPRLSPDGHVIYFTSGRTLLINPNRTREDAAADFAKLSSWDNSNNNVWYTEFDAKAACKR